MKSGIVKVWLTVVLVAMLLFITTGASLAALSWCDNDLGPMATIAEERNSDKAYKAEEITISVPTVAVSIAKQGTNPHK